MKSTPIDFALVHAASALRGGPDALREDIKRRQREAVRYILHAAQLIGPAIEKDTAQGYEWLSRTLVRH